MGFSFVTEIPSPDVIRERFPLAPELAARKKERDEEIKKIITGESDKLLVVVGPCSADNEEAVVDYVSRLVKVQEIFLMLLVSLIKKRIPLFSIIQLFQVKNWTLLIWIS